MYCEVDTERYFDFVEYPSATVATAGERYQ